MRELQNSFDTYWQNLFPDPSALFLQAKEQSRHFKKEAISLTAAEGRLLSELVRQSNAKKFVEIGTLTGYSALWILSGMDQGELWSFEKDPACAEWAQQCLQKNLWGKAHVIVGDALATLPSIENQGPFDGIFIDGNKQAYPAYLDWAEKNIKKNGLVLADNVWLGGSVYGAKDDRFSEKQISAMKDFNHRLSDAQKYYSFIVPTQEGLYVAKKLF